MRPNQFNIKIVEDTCYSDHSKVVVFDEMTKCLMCVEFVKPFLFAITMKYVYVENQLNFLFTLKTNSIIKNYMTIKLVCKQKC